MRLAVEADALRGAALQMLLREACAEKDDAGLDKVRILHPSPNLNADGSTEAEAAHRF